MGRDPLTLFESLYRFAETSDWRAASENFALDATLQGIFGHAPVVGRDAIARYFRDLKRFAWRYQIMNIVVRGDWVMADCEYHPADCRIPLELSPLRPTRAVLQSSIFAKVEGGLIVDYRSYLGPLALTLPKGSLGVGVSVSAHASSPNFDPFSLTAREREVLVLLATGVGNQEIADHTGLGINTVRFHLRNIFGKLRARTRTEAVVVG